MPAKKPKTKPAKGQKRETPLNLSPPAAIRAMMEQFMALKPKFTMQITSLAPAENLALVRNRWTLDATGPDGEPIAMNGTAFEVMRRQADGTWLWLIDQSFAA